MRLKNSLHAYGFVSVSLHWLVAVVVLGMFAMGVWMVDLGYYDTWYHKAPALHKSIGALLFAVLVFSLVWRFTTVQPQPLLSHTAWERFGAKAGHGIIYFMLLGLIASGYLISTADGVGIPVFGLFEIPATIYDLPEQADIAGFVHKYLAWGLMFVVFIHAVAAFKHHWFDRDATLVRMLGKPSRKSKG